MKIYKFSAFVLCLVSLGACGAKQAPVAGPETTLEKGVAQMDEARAGEIFGQMKKQLAFQNGAVVDSMSDAMNVLHSDELLKFPVAIDYLKGQDGAEAQGMLAQMQLAYAEAMLVTGKIMTGTAGRLNERLEKLAGREMAPEIKANMESSLKENIAKLQEMSQALDILAQKQLAAGELVAKKVIAENPDSYLGYRVASDYYRIVGEWANFDNMVAKIREINPESNGLNFQLGASGWLREQNVAVANEYLQKALQKDSQFVRAQAFLVMAQDNPVKVFEQYKALQKLNENHQIVVLAGYAITKAYDAAQKGE